MINGFYRTGTSFLASSCHLKFPKNTIIHSHNFEESVKNKSIVPVREPIATISSTMAFTGALTFDEFLQIQKSYVRQYSFYLSNFRKIILLDFKKFTVDVESELSKIQGGLVSNFITQEMAIEETMKNSSHVKSKVYMLDRSTFPRSVSKSRKKSNLIVSDENSLNYIKEAEEIYLKLLEKCI